MSKNRKIGWSFIIFLSLWATSLYAEGKEGDDVCFSQAQAERFAVEIKEGRICSEMIPKYDATISEKDLQIKNGEDQLALEKKKFEELEKKAALDKKITDERDNARLKEIEDLKKPRWGSLFGSFGIGAGAVALLLLLL